MLYPDLHFPTLPDRPYFYSNFVSTLDGKVQVVPKAEGYWPLGSELDYQTLIDLRVPADALIHGRKTASWVRTLDRLGASAFQEERRKAGKKAPMLYVVVSSHPTGELAQYMLDAPAGTAALLATTEEAAIPSELAGVEVVRLGKQLVQMDLLVEYLQQRGIGTALVEGGPQLMAHFLKNDLLDELFLTLAPKVMGNEPGKTLTMVEGHLFSPADVKKYRLLSVQAVENEVYLRYARHTD